MNIEQRVQEAEDRLAIRKLVDDYAYCADTRNAQGQMALFTENTNFEVYYDPKSDTPSQVVSRRADLFPIFDNLNIYNATMHFNGQHSVTFNGDKATGIAYCMAHHLTIEEGRQKLMVAAIRYYDTFVKESSGWLFAERKLMVDWIENR
ncbi:nuclear transport factor 2 family protein [Chryseobacterium phosphatilyticum]|uniref:Nuclear transport factor 2 family protein n=1 Tax=Chryseobacterium phosphatilyticum TaxID=475075 RepID=A0A316X6J4_9FLAO|nr:nuclear transport factor 2 family protein [Chryseobacterium phosphatilyticum]PWN69412.1 nuclear transport factor 2 family protein [Chryseobacterium phosphatilyticum]